MRCCRIHIIPGTTGLTAYNLCTCFPLTCDTVLLSCTVSLSILESYYSVYLIVVIISVYWRFCIVCSPCTPLTFTCSLAIIIRIIFTGYLCRCLLKIRQSDIYTVILTSLHIILSLISGEQSWN